MVFVFVTCMNTKMYTMTFVFATHLNSKMYTVAFQIWYTHEHKDVHNKRCFICCMCKRKDVHSGLCISCTLEHKDVHNSLIIFVFVTYMNTKMSTVSFVFVTHVNTNIHSGSHFQGKNKEITGTSDCEECMCIQSACFLCHRSPRRSWTRSGPHCGCWHAHPLRTSTRWWRASSTPSSAQTARWWPSQVMEPMTGLPSRRLTLDSLWWEGRPAPRLVHEFSSPLRVFRLKFLFPAGWASAAMTQSRVCVEIHSQECVLKYTVKSVCWNIRSRVCVEIHTLKSGCWITVKSVCWNAQSRVCVEVHSQECVLKSTLKSGCWNTVKSVGWNTQSRVGVEIHSQEWVLKYTIDSVGWNTQSRVCVDTQSRVCVKIRNQG